MVLIAKRHGGHHGGSWKVAYADFVTAMMAFFLVLWILGLDKPVREAVAGYFRDPTMAEGGGAGGPVPVSPAELEPPVSPPREPVETSPAPPPAAAAAAADRARLEALRESLEAEIRSSPELEEFRGSVTFEMTGEGLRIEVLESAVPRFFESGSAKATPAAEELLATMARVIGLAPNRLVIEGHTDGRPYPGQGYSNWELSADRANAARRVLEANGLRPGQVASVRGFADSRLRVPGDPLHPSNRRVSMLLEFRSSGA